MDISAGPGADAAAVTVTVPLPFINRIFSPLAESSSAGRATAAADAELSRDQVGAHAALERTATRLRGDVAFALPPEAGVASARDAAAAFQRAAADAAMAWRRRVAVRAAPASTEGAFALDRTAGEMAVAVDAALGAAGVLAQLAPVPRLAQAVRAWVAEPRRA